MNLDALHLLDQVQDLRQLDAFDGQHFLERLGDEAKAGEDVTLADLGARLDALAAALAMIDVFASKTMRIRLSHALADAPVTPQFRLYLATMVTSYAGDLELLRGRVSAAVARADPASANAIAEAVVDAAERVLVLRAYLSEGLLSLVRTLATERARSAETAARDRSSSESDRRAWRVAHLDLTLLVDKPERLAEGSSTERWKKLPVPDEEPAPPPPKSAGLLEVD